MNPKYVNYVDILESINVKPYKYENVQIYKMNWTDNLALIKNEKQDRARGLVLDERHAAVGRVAAVPDELVHPARLFRRTLQISRACPLKRRGMKS